MSGELRLLKGWLPHPCVSGELRLLKDWLPHPPVTGGKAGRIEDRPAEA